MKVILLQAIALGNHFIGITNRCSGSCSWGRHICTKACATG